MSCDGEITTIGESKLTRTNEICVFVAMMNEKVVVFVAEKENTKLEDDIGV